MNFNALFFLLLVAGSSLAQFDVDKNDHRSVIEYDFSFLLPAGTRTCFYQYAFSGSRLKFSYKVLTAASSMMSNAIRVDVRDEERKPIITIKMDSEADIPTLTVVKDGDIEFCFNNYHGRYTQKKVDVFIGVIPSPSQQRIDDIIESTKNETIEKYDNMTDQVFNIISSLFHVSHFMHFSRRLEHVDMAMLQEKLTFINRCSVLLTILIVLISFLQTYSLKRLFRERLTTGGSKPRA